MCTLKVEKNYLCEKQKRLTWTNIGKMVIKLAFKLKLTIIYRIYFVFNVFD